MNTANIILLTIAILSVVIAIVVIIQNKCNTRKTINQISSMLDSAISGNFTETTYDESVLSSLGTKLNQYFCSSIIYSKKIEVEKDKVKSLISDISHQTKTPISNILLYSEILSEHTDLPEECSQSVSQICTQAEKLNFLMGSLIKVSRLETNIISVSKSKNNIDELVRLSVNQVGSKANNKNIKISLNLDRNTDNKKVLFDMKWTVEALHNIIENSVKYTNINGNITITTFPYEFFYRIDITDNGLGIDEHEINRIFQRFYRSHNVAEYEGVGIGLFLTKEIINTQGGYIKVKSKIGKGSTFSVFLPIEN